MLFILVIYKCNIESSASYQTITRSLASNNKQGILFIFDNSPETHVIDNINIKVWKKVEYIHCSENKGLSFAYNQGANYARKNNIDWIVLLDQDTAFSEDFICRLNEAIELHSNIKLFAPIIRLNKDRPFSPTRYKHKRGYNLKLKSGLYSLFRYSPVNSGMVVNTISYFESGGYNPLIKLDFSDYQFIERFRKIEGMFYLLNTVAIQDFSNNEKDIDKLIIRFKIYCECARKCERKNIFDSLEYFYSVLRHTIGLLIKTRKIIFLYVFFTNYLIKKSK